MPHNSTHSVMFHHFHDSFHEPSQGSLSATDFKKMLTWLKERYSILGAMEYADKAFKGTLDNLDICLSFDDALKCQYDIALPILNDFNIDAFFFVYSSAFSDNPDYLEIYRYFRTSNFNNIDKFYIKFFDFVRIENPKLYDQHHVLFKNSDYLSSYPFYSENDKWYRYLRDDFLNYDKYHEIMKNLMIENNFKIEDAMKKLWISEDELVDINNEGHSIGLHSYSHPTRMGKLNKIEQEYEYRKNYEHLTNLIGKPIYSMSHPCGDYNRDTLKILSEIGINIGFRSSMSKSEIVSLLEIPREDHSNVFKEMNK